MEEIPNNHLGCIPNPINNGIIIIIGWLFGISSINSIDGISVVNLFDVASSCACMARSRFQGCEKAVSESSSHKNSAFRTEPFGGHLSKWHFLILIGFYMNIPKNSGFSPQIIHLNRVFHYKPMKTNILPWKMMVGRCISYWKSTFLGDMLVFWGVYWLVYRDP